MINQESKDVKSFFDVPQKYLHKDFGIRIRRDIIQNVVKNYHFKNVLDIGCGDGSISLPLITREKSLDLADLSANMLKVAQSNIPKELLGNVTLHNTSLEQFETTKKFDLILAIGLLAHVPDIASAIGILQEMLSSKGHLIIQFSDYSKLTTKMSFMTRSSKLHPLNKIYKSDLIELAVKNDLAIKSQIRFASILPGMGYLNDQFLYKFCQISINNNFLSFYNSEYLLVLTKK